MRYCNLIRPTSGEVPSFKGDALKSLAFPFSVILLYYDQVILSPKKDTSSNSITASPYILTWNESKQQPSTFLKCLTNFL